VAVFLILQKKKRGQEIIRGREEDTPGEKEKRRLLSLQSRKEGGIGGTVRYGEQAIRSGALAIMSTEGAVKEKPN